jgi:hypothetical protein
MLTPGAFVIAHLLLFLLSQDKLRLLQTPTPPTSFQTTFHFQQPAQITMSTAVHQVLSVGIHLFFSFGGFDSLFSSYTPAAAIGAGWNMPAEGIFMLLTSAFCTTRPDPVWCASRLPSAYCRSRLRR